MSHMVLKSKEELEAEWNAARRDIDPEVVTRVMKGLPLPNGTEFTEPYLTLRRAWSAYHPRMK